MTIWNLLFYIDFKTSSKIKLICVLTHHYWSIPFYAMSSCFFLTFSCICQIYIAEVLIVHFLELYHLRFFNILVPKWGQFCEGSTPNPDPYLCCTFWDSTPSPAPVPSMSHLRLCGGSTPDLDPYLCCTFWGSTLSLAPVPSMSHLRLCGGSTLDPYPNPYLCCTFWGSTTSPAPVPSMSPLDHVKQSFWVPKTLCYIQNLTFHPIFLFILILIAYV